MRALNCAVIVDGGLFIITDNSAWAARACACVTLSALASDGQTGGGGGTIAVGEAGFPPARAPVAPSDMAAMQAAMWRMLFWVMSASKQVEGIANVDAEYGIIPFVEIAHGEIDGRPLQRRREEAGANNWYIAHDACAKAVCI